MDGLYGYIDSAGRIIIPPKYTVGLEFHENRALFGRDRSLYGFLEPAGREVISMRFSAGALFSEGRAAVEVKRTAAGSGGSMGFINPTGRWIIPPRAAQFAWSGDFHEGLALAKSDKTGNKIGFINKRGRWAIAPQFDWAEPFAEGVAAADGDGGRGFIGRTGRFVIPPAFLEVHSFSAGVALVYRESCKPLFVDHSGRIAIRTPGDFASAFSEGLSIVEVGGTCGLGGRYGFMDKMGRLVIDPRYELVGPFSEGLAAARLAGNWGFIDRRGDVVIPARFADTAAGAPGPFRSGLARVYSRIPDERPPNASAMAGLQFGYINAKGHYVWPPTY
jgi:hypothetical protein